MDSKRKVLWKEGLFLTQQHFQAENQYHEGTARFFTKSLTEFYWGIYQVNLDLDAISNGQFQVKSLQAIMKDGTLLRCPDIDQVPPMRTINDVFTPDKSFLTVYIGLPKERDLYPNVIGSESQSEEHARYIACVQSVNDYVSGSKSREIEFISLKPEIRFEGETSDNYDLLPIARLVLKAGGRPALDDDYMPPSLALDAYPGGNRIADSMYGQVNALVKNLLPKMTYQNDGKLKLTIADLTNYFQLRELLEALSDFQHFYDYPNSHPYSFYRTLSQLTAKLSLLFGNLKNENAYQMPSYKHDMPASSLKELHHTLIEIFDKMEHPASNEIQLVEDKSNEGIWRGDLSSHAFHRGDEFYLLAKSAVGDEAFTRNFPLACKISAPQRINNLIIHAVSGVELQRVSHPPQTLPGTGKGEYFRLNTNHEMWQEILNEKIINIFARKEDFPKLELKLFISRV
jgi:type VI secretion system protein ImpJ